MVRGTHQHNYTKGPTIVAGDFNCPDINWLNWSVSSNPVSAQLHNFALVNGFIQAVDEPTRGNNIIDLVFINEPVRLSSIAIEPPFSTSDHNTVSFTVAFDYPATSRPLPSQCRYLWKQGDYATMSNYLRNFDWSHMMSTHFNPDDLWTAFCDVLNYAIDLYIPSVMMHNSNIGRALRKHPSYIRVLFKRKLCLWQQMKRCPHDSNLRVIYK